ncbi:hypothetical protein Glove_86g173 [Diversispora epigaea]|uniref:CN hydrolase domain-containing protein n=1 Tax=Diversispora epigaea TaxID=1348612 RepID=A0A397J990_9GLOM|nr:hypothetical protein Glove_86g173 [Diversispora epigaea]
MKIACLQFNPKLGEIEKNQNFASGLLESYKPGDIDILVLPEMAFTGYMFKSKEHIKPYLEDAETGITIRWAKAQAIRLRSFVMVGYPQIVKGNPDIYYNSICFIGRDGELIETYSKHFLYTTDESWANEGPEFKAINVDSLGKVGFGICMDLNRYQFKAPFDVYEFADFHLQQRTKIVLCSMAWLSNNDNYNDNDNNHEISTINYWCNRLSPLILNNNNDIGNILVVVCNRTGIEDSTTFAGSSSILSISPSTGSVHLLGSLGKRQESIMIIDVPIDDDT